MSKRTGSRSGHAGGDKRRKAARDRGRGQGRRKQGTGRGGADEASGRGAARGRAESAGRRRNGGANGPGREGLVRRAHPPGSEGQRLEVEDRAGDVWRVDCPGEPLEAGSRVIFESLPTTDSGPGLRRGVLVRVVDAARASWVCTLRRGHWGCSLIPFAGVETPRFRLAARDARDAEDGSRVVVVPIRKPARSVARGRPRRSGAGSPAELPVRVVEVLGPVGDPDADHRAVVWKHRLATGFSRRARLEFEAIEAEPPPAERARRLDLRHLPFITIDPSSARDHDDALFAERRPAPRMSLVEAPGTDEGAPARSADEAKARRAPRQAAGAGWQRRLWVAIADVAHFVAEGGWIDAEARRRGNSFYFPDRAIPMLPERLSSDLCSLRPEVDRLAVVVELRLGAEGGVVDALFHEALIRSHARLAYEDAAAWLASSDASGGPDASAPAWADSLACLAEIAQDLARARRASGAVALDLPEIEIVIGGDGRPSDARMRERNQAHALVEEAMLAANRAVAAALDRAQRATIHRVHLPPNPRKLEALEGLLARLGVSDTVDLEEPGGLARVLDLVRGTASEERVHGAVLRAMSQARYEAASNGHFALHFDHYLHFTSPIRRYADLEVHRAMKRMLRGEPGEGETSGAATSARLAIWLSGRERVAIEVERDAAALAACAIMSGREGEWFTAQVMAVTEHGLFIRLESPAVSGLIPMRALPGFWQHEIEDEALVSESSGRRIGLGDTLDVRLSEVDADRGRLAFRWAGRRRQPGEEPSSSSSASSSESLSQSS